MWLLKNEIIEMFASYLNFRPCGHRFPLSSDSGSANPDMTSFDFSRFGLSNSLAKAIRKTRNMAKPPAKAGGNY